MDALLTNTQAVAGAYPYWDFQVVNGQVPILQGNVALSQEATVIAYTQKNLIPQLPGVGVNWTGLLLGSETLSSIDSQITNGYQQNSLPFKNVYSQSGNQLQLNVVPQ
jgi:hypothetical protein